MKRRRGLVIAAALLVALAAVFYLLRGANISNTLKKLVLPELENATGRRFVARNISINLFPLFVEIRGLKGFDEKGEKIISAERVKGYVGLSGILDKEIGITRLVIKEPSVSLEKREIEAIAGNVKRYLAKEPEMPFKVVVKSIEVGKADISLTDGAAGLKVQGLRAEAILSKEPWFRLVSPQVSADSGTGQKAFGMLETVFRLKGERLELDSIRFSSKGSILKLSGGWDSQGGTGAFRAETLALVQTVKDFLGLKNKGDGYVRAQGEIRLHDLSAGLFSGVEADLRAKGDLYLETLMEVLKVKERLEGRVAFEGSLKGPLNDLNGQAEARMKQGNIYGVEIDRLSTEIKYSKGVMSFT
ncbi:MAG: AsmA-like C-terminal region-containing protein, partial [Nitrospirales bacterium]|nr:AsmA-like C-terminal region-containing protein [Nitrospirales bacterium]